MIRAASGHNTVCTLLICAPALPCASHPVVLPAGVMYFTLMKNLMVRRAPVTGDAVLELASPTHALFSPYVYLPTPCTDLAPLELLGGRLGARTLRTGTRLRPAYRCDA